MASEAHDVHDKHNFDQKLYTALMRKDEGKVIELCREVPDQREMHILTIQNDTVLHLATYFKQENLVLKLLDELPQHHLCKLTRQNHSGNTILHEAATSDQAVQAAETMLQKAPELLAMRNHRGETAPYRAASYGKTKMFRLLSQKISDQYDEVDRQAFLRRDDKTNILHISIIAEHFDLAQEIANKYEHLIGEKDGDGMTGLQLLSCNPSAFKIGCEHKLLMRLIYFSICPGRPEAVDHQKEKQRYNSALELARLLIEKDTSWEATYPLLEQSKPKSHKYGVNPEASPNEKKNGEGPSNIGSLSQGEREGEGYQRSDITRTVNNVETPLFLATKSGCVEIVKGILERYPQAVEYIDDEGRNILHVAIKYRQLHIFRLVKKMEFPLTRLVRKVDNNGNTILRTVGIKRGDYVADPRDARPGAPIA